MRVSMGNALVVTAAVAWLLFFVALFGVAPGNYGLLDATVPPEPAAAARFHVARALFHLAHVAQVVVVLLAGFIIVARRHRGSWSAGLALLIAVPFVSLAVLFGTFPNVGLPFGYYGKFNRIQSVLNSCPGFRVVDSWQHRDVTLEDFGFSVREPGGATLELEFMSSSPLHEMIASLPDACR